MPDAVKRLHEAALLAKAADPSSSRTAKLMGEGMSKMAKKVAEEAVEVGLDAVVGDRRRVVEESADLLYNLTVLWAAIGIAPGEIWGEMERREKAFGIAEKLPKTGGKG